MSDVVAALAGRAELIEYLRTTLNARIDQDQKLRRRDGKLTRTGETEALAFLCGAAAAVHALGLDETHGVTGIAWLASVRGAADFLEG